MSLVGLVELLPGYNCGECGFKSCREFARALTRGADPGRCSFLEQDGFSENAARIEQLLKEGICEQEEIKGVIDGLAADFALAPLPGEPSCREDLHPFDRGVAPQKGDVLKYRPLGCPVTHFGRVLKGDHGLVTVHVVGPRHLLGDEDFRYEDVGVCLVAAFEGVVSRGRVPDVGETVSFLPDHCMMQKVHSGVVVHSEGKMVRIESIDLKVW